MKRNIIIIVCVIAIALLIGQIVLWAKDAIGPTENASAVSLQYPTVISWGDIYNSLPEGERLTYEVVPGDSLGKIAKKFGTTSALIKKVNQLKSDTIYAGQKLKIWKATFDINVVRAQNILLLAANTKILKMYTVSTGKIETGTPSGEYLIKTKLENPVWYHGGKVYPPGHPDNGLGSRWMGFDLDGYGIHGTIHPDQIGQPVSAGCVRMLNEDVEELFDIVPEGTKVVIN